MTPEQIERTREKLRADVVDAADDEAQYTQIGGHPTFRAALDALVRFERADAVAKRLAEMPCPASHDAVCGGQDEADRELEAIIIRETLGEQK